MMAIIFLGMSAALVSGWFGRRPLAIALVGLTLLLAVPVWSILIALALITAFALKLCVLGTEQGARPRQPRSLLGRAATVVSLYVIAIALVNFGSVVVQCGLGQCHTTGYVLLK